MTGIDVWPMMDAAHSQSPDMHTFDASSRMTHDVARLR